MFKFFINFDFYIFFFKEIQIRFKYIILSLIFTTIISYFFKEQLIFFFTKHLLYNMLSHRFIFTELTKILLTYLKIVLVFSIFINIPFIWLHLFYIFINSLFLHEIKQFINITFCYFISFYLSIFIIFNIIFPTIILIFLKFEQNLFFFPLHFEAKLEDVFSGIFFLYINIILCFQMPIYIYILICMDILTMNAIFSNRKFFYFFFIVISALITPPEIINQCLILSFFLIIFELFLIYLILKKKLNF